MIPGKDDWVLDAFKYLRGNRNPVPAPRDELWDACLLGSYDLDAPYWQEEMKKNDAWVRAQLDREQNEEWRYNYRITQEDMRFLHALNIKPT